MSEITNVQHSRESAMRVFISWSGDRSRGLAQALADWLPLVLHYVEPWMSEAHIDAGQRWGIAVAKELEVSNFGIICVTRENLNAPWVLFEAGALAKSMKDSQVIPLLLDLDYKDISGPLAQFQAKKSEKEGLEEVINSINRAASQPVPDERARNLFGALWPQLEAKISAIPNPTQTAKARRPADELMEELVAGIRSVELRVREMVDSSRSTPDTRRERFHIAQYVADIVGSDPREPMALLVWASIVRESLPWVYDFALELYHEVTGGNLEAMLEAAVRLQRAVVTIIHSPAPTERLGIDERVLSRILQAVEHIQNRPADVADTDEITRVLHRKRSIRRFPERPQE